MVYKNLCSGKALIWRIVRRPNVQWALGNGLFAANGGVYSGDWVSIGSRELMDKRAQCKLPIGPGGVLNDYKIATMRY